MATIFRFRSHLLAFAVMLVLFAASAMPASAGGTNAGPHNHGAGLCYTNGKLVIQGPTVNVASEQNPIGQPLTQNVYYRSNLNRWNGTTWVYVKSTGWVSGTLSGGYSLKLANSQFTIYQGGYYKVSTEIQWYAGSTLIGSSPNTYVDFHKNMSTGAGVPYCTYG